MRHYERINLQRVPPHYYLYSNLSMLVIAGQSFFFMIHYILKKSIINDIRERLLDSENGGSEHFKDKVGNNEIGFSFIVTKKNNQIV